MIFARPPLTPEKLAIADELWRQYRERPIRLPGELMAYKILQFDERTISEMDLKERADQGWRVLSVAWDKSGAMVSVLLEHESKESEEMLASASKAIKDFSDAVEKLAKAKGITLFSN